MATSLNVMSNSALRELAEQNSANWHGADAATRDALHAQNVEINRILDERTGSESRFDSGSGKWSVAPGTASTPLEEYRALFNGQSGGYSQLRKAQETAQRAAVQKAVNALEDSRHDAQAQYAGLFRQLYVDKMDQQLAAAGVTGGAAESTRLSYDTAYEDALRQSEQGRIDAVASIDRAIAEARLTGDVEAANAAAKAMKEQTDAYSDALKFLINRQDDLDAQQEKYAREDAAYARRLAEQQLAAAADSEKPELTAAQVNAALRANIRTDAVLRAYEYYYGQPYRG